ncbi:hypothetical protein [Streptomyces sp. NBC_00859]|uniref:hypothetical protein n=1 Tax=Streptomyces sp. NBC_00859 TaxID=2903682 RepID=UPI003865A9EE|nr:hypothetical protein OG584_06785 [Streptomyces sp. NBC_00859]
MKHTAEPAAHTARKALATLAAAALLALGGASVPAFADESPAPSTPPAPSTTSVAPPLEWSSTG